MVILSPGKLPLSLHVHEEGIDRISEEKRKENRMISPRVSLYKVQIAKPKSNKTFSYSPFSVVL